MSELSFFVAMINSHIFCFGIFSCADIRYKRSPVPSLMVRSYTEIFTQCEAAEFLPSSDSQIHSDSGDQHFYD